MYFFDEDLFRCIRIGNQSGNKVAKAFKNPRNRVTESMLRLSDPLATVTPGDHDNNHTDDTSPVLQKHSCNMLVPLITLIFVLKVKGESHDLQFLNELPLDKLIRLKSSLQELVTTYENVTTAPTYLPSFGAQAMALNAPPIKKADYDGLQKKDSQSKLNKLFTVSVTTLAFLAFGGYLLCLIVQAVKAKESHYNTGTVAPTFFISSGIKKKPQSQFAFYGRRKRDNSRVERSLQQLDLPPEQMFEVLLQLCEGYAKWTERYGDTDA